jgi:hypothetical protein
MPSVLKKLFAWFSIGCVLFVSFGVWIVWRHLNERLHSPEFRKGVERGLSNALEGKMVLDDLQGHVGFHPWVGVQNVSFAGDNGDFRGTAKEIRVAMDVLPLLQRKVVFSQITFLSPRLRIRRRPDGSRPVLPPSSPKENQIQSGLAFRIDQLSIENAVIDLVDESIAEHPHLQVQADVSIHRQTPGEGLEIRMSGAFLGDENDGKLSLEGHVGNETALQLTVSRFPLRAAAAFWPELRPWGGAVGITATYAGTRPDPRWEVHGQLKDLHHVPTGTILPLQVNWHVRSEASSEVRAVWASTTSEVVANVRMDDLHHRRLYLQVNGKNLDLREFAPVLSLLPSFSTGTVQRGAPWNMETRVNLENVTSDQWTAQHFTVVAEGNKARGRLTELRCHVFQSTLTLSGVWGSTSHPKNVVALTGTAESNSVQVNGAWQSGLQAKPPRDFLLDSTTLWGFDVRVSSALWKGVSVREANGRFSLKSDGVVRAENVDATLGEGTIHLNGEIGGLPENGPLTFALNGRMKDVETKDLVAAISTNAYLINGQFSGRVNLSGPLRPWNPNALNGNVAFSGRKGEFRTAPKVLEIFSALKINSLLRRMGGEKETGLPFDVFEASGPLRAGRYVLDQPLLLKNDSFQLAYTGWMHVRFESGKGTLLFNFLESTSHLVKAIPIVSSLILGSNGELMPLVVDVAVENGKIDVNPRSVKTLSGPLVNVVKNVFRLPFQIFSPKKPKPNSYE